MELYGRLRQLHRRALDDVTGVVATITAADLLRPTPCAGWDLSALLGHMIGQNHGFAIAASRGDAAAEDFRERPPAADRLQALWRESAEAVSTAFAAALPDRPVRLVEISDERRFSPATVVSFQLVDTLVHRWDVARSLGADYRPDDELAGAALRIAHQVPDGPTRNRPGAAFAPAVARSAGDDWDLTLAHLGRDPGR